MSSALSYLRTALLLLFFFFFNFHGSNANFPNSTNCPIHKCKSGPEFHYPFWKIDDSAAADQYCGYRGFGLNCSPESGEPILTLPNNDAFYAKGINFSEHTITLVDIDVVDQSCPRPRHNISLDALPFDYSPSDVNLIFYFNCTTSNPDDAYPVRPILCWGSSYGGITNQSFVFKEGKEPEGFDWSEKCAEKVVATVMGTEDIINDEVNQLIDAFREAMKTGLKLNWRMAMECGSCETSGGFCGGYDTTKPEFLCFCKQGHGGTSTNGHCKKENKNNWRIKVVVGATTAGIAFLLSAILFSIKHWISEIRENNKEDAEAFIQNIGPLAVKRYKFSEEK